MTLTHHFKTITLGFALFSMFFGAGNVVFPLVVGKQTGPYIFFALAGLFITAVLIPFAGLYTATLYEGSHQRFFSALGKWPGLILAASILGLLGPFGVIPRCIALSEATFHLYFPETKVLLFNLFSCALILAFTLKRSHIVALLGNILTPLLIGVLGIIIIAGLYFHPHIQPVSGMTSMEALTMGFTEGYQTMDLLAALFFASFITSWLREHLPVEVSRTDLQLGNSITVRAILIAGILLGSVYVGFGLLAASFGAELDGIGQAELLGTIAGHVLGEYAGLVVCIAVCVACLTTAISLAGIFADFIRKDIFGNKVSYPAALMTTVAITFAFSMLEFNGIVGFLAPILSVCYPGLIVLTAYNWMRHQSLPTRVSG